MDFLLDFDLEQMRSAFNMCAFVFAHRLQGNRLFSLSPLAKLAALLEQKGGRRDVYNAAAGTAFAETFAKNGARGLEPGCAIKEIETSGSRMVLMRIEQDPEYNEIVQECLRELSLAVPDLQPRHIQQAQGFVFVTSPHGITYYHIDPQWSFLAQIHGRKTYRIYDVHDPNVISNEEIENYYHGESMAARYNSEKDRNARVFDLAPVDAVNQLLHAPHSARAGGEYSISFTVAVVLDTCGSQKDTHRANRWRRKRGFNPAPVGCHHMADRLKGAVYRTSLSAQAWPQDSLDRAMPSAH